MSEMTMVSMAVSAAGLADFFAEAGVGRRQREKCERERNEDKIGVHDVPSIAPSERRA